MSKSKNNILFRKSVKGYNKDDVNNYILQTSRNFESFQNEIENKRKEADAEIMKIRNDYEQARSSLVISENKIDKLSHELSEAQIKLAEFQKEKDNIEQAYKKAEYEKSISIDLQSQLSEAENKIQLLEQELLNISSKSKTCCADDTQIPVSPFSVDFFKDNSSNPFLSNTINDTASEESISNTDKTIHAKKEISEMARAMIKRINEYLLGANDTCFQEISSAVKEIQYSITSIISDFERRTDEMNSKVDYIHSMTTEAVEKELKKFAEDYEKIKSE